MSKTASSKSTKRARRKKNKRVFFISIAFFPAASSFVAGFFYIFASMKTRLIIIEILLLLFCAACHTPTHEARRMVATAERLADILPDSTITLIDSVLRMPANLREHERMDMALLQAEAMFGTTDAISPLMDNEFFDDHSNLSTSPELERAAAYYAKKKQYGKAALAALYSGFVQQHYNENEAAMRSFKEAEEYGSIIGDSLAVAQAQYWIGKMLLNEGMEQEALTMFEVADKGFGNRPIYRTLTQNIMGTAYMLIGQYDDAETCLRKSLFFAKMVGSTKSKQKALNNYAVLHRQKGEYQLAIDNLRMMVNMPDSDTSALFMFYLNMGKTYMAAGMMDSATVYYTRLENSLPNSHTKQETLASAYNVLSRFAEKRGDTSKALYYREKYEKIVAQIFSQRQEQVIYNIQKRYDYESMQNRMNQKLIRRHHIIIVMSILAMLGLAALVLSTIRLARTRKQEAEAKTRLFHFMQQNKELQQKHEDSEKVVMDYAQQLSDALNKDALIMRKLEIYLGNKGDTICLSALNKAVFGNNDHWEALMKVFDTLYPDVRKNLAIQYPELTEMEQKDFILSYFNVSRDEEALLFNKSVHMVDKWRNGARKKMQAHEEEQREKGDKRS